MFGIKLEVNKKANVKGKPEYVKVGEVEAFVPGLEELGFAAEIAKNEAGEDVMEDGLPVYKDERANFLFDCVIAQVKAKARNKLVPSTATVKPGQTIATTLAELMASGERAGNPEALAAIHAAKAAFAKWVAGLGKSANAQTTLNTLFSNKQALSLQSAENKAKMDAYITQFAETLEAAELERFAKYLQSVQDMCKTEVAELDDF